MARKNLQDLIESQARAKRSAIARLEKEVDALEEHLAELAAAEQAKQPPLPMSPAKGGK